MFYRRSTYIVQQRYTNSRASGLCVLIFFFSHLIFPWRTWQWKPALYAHDCAAIRTNREAAALEVHGRPKSKRPSLYTHLRTHTRARTHLQIYMYIYKNSARTQTYIFLFIYFIYYSLLLSFFFFFFYCNICIISIYICVTGACTHTNWISSRTVLVTCIVQCR